MKHCRKKGGTWRCYISRVFAGRAGFLTPLLAGIWLLYGIPAGGGELRGLWVDAIGEGFQDAAQIQRLVQDCREYNFNAVFVQLRRRGDALYLPNGTIKEPRTSRLAPNFDALAELIEQCHKGTPRIEVHFWFTSHLIWSSPLPPTAPGHLFNIHQDWLTKDSAGGVKMANGFYLDPGHPDASQWLHDIALDITKRYNIDGFHWDYLRYPGSDSGYNKAAMNRYLEEFGEKKPPLHRDSKFSEWRRRQVTDFLRWTTADLLQIKPGLIVSVAVLANHDDSFGYTFAEWGNWCKEGILDIAIPMNFAADQRSTFASRADRASNLRGKRAVCLGVAGYLNSIDGTLAQLKRTRELGFPGAVFYSYQSAVAHGPAKPILAPMQPVHNATIVDNKSAKAEGEWRRGRFGKYHDTDYSFVLDGGKGANRLHFVPKTTRAGGYDVYEWHVQGVNRATDVPFEIRHAKGTNVIRVDQRRDGSQWNFLGRFEAATNSALSVIVSDDVQNPALVVVADAVRFDAVADGTPAKKPNIEELQAAEAAKVQQTVTNRDMVFAAIKKEHQPEWEAVPTFPWKTDTNRAILKGIVKEASSGRPLYNAVVEVTKGSKATQKTESHGAYAFFDTSPGEQEIIIRAEGFRSVTNRITLHPGLVTQSDFTLDR